MAAAFAQGDSLILFPEGTRNTTDDVRKAYILQYVPDGARIWQGNPAVGPPTGTAAIGDDTRCFAVVRDGLRIEPPPLPEVEPVRIISERDRNYPDFVVDRPQDGAS